MTTYDWERYWIAEPIAKHYGFNPTDVFKYLLELQVRKEDVAKVVQLALYSTYEFRIPMKDSMKKAVEFVTKPSLDSKPA